MHSERFLNALGEFPSNMAGESVNDLASLSNGRKAQDIDTVAPNLPVSLAKKNNTWLMEEF